MIPRATADLYRAEQARVSSALTRVRDEWDDAGEPGALRSRIPRLAALLSAAMVGAAADGAAAVPLALAQTGFEVAPVGQIVAAAFGLTASDGRSLLTLMTRPVRLAELTSMDQGRKLLDIVTHTQVADAARGGSSVAIATRPEVGYVRMANPPCCQDCAQLAGKFFRYNAGFDRHPRCDCQHRPAHEDESPSGYRTTIRPDQITDLTVGQRMAMEDGANLSQVVNAYREAPTGKYGKRMVSAMGDWSTDGTTERAWQAQVRAEVARQRGDTLVWTERTVRGVTYRRTGPRLTPDAIYRYARTRREAVQLLALNGYITGDLADVARLAG